MVLPPGTTQERRPFADGLATDQIDPRGTFVPPQRQSAVIPIANVVEPGELVLIPPGRASLTSYVDRMCGYFPPGSMLVGPGCNGLLERRLNRWDYPLFTIGLIEN